MQISYRNLDDVAGGVQVVVKDFLIASLDRFVEKSEIAANWPPCC